MSNKINVLKIITEHISTLKDYGTGRYDVCDLILFFFIPFLIAAILPFFKLLITKEVANVLITSFSIFVGLLFNLLLLIYDVSGKPGLIKLSSNPKFNLLRQTYINTSFCILISIFTLILLLVFFIPINIIMLKILSFLVYYLLGVFVLTLFMVLKRVYTLLSNEFL